MTASSCYYRNDSLVVENCYVQLFWLVNLIILFFSFNCESAFIPIALFDMFVHFVRCEFPVNKKLV